MEWIKFFLYFILGLAGGYVSFRILFLAIFRSYFEMKKLYEGGLNERQD